MKKHDSTSNNNWFIFLAVLILLVAATLRFYRLDAQSMWYDEGNSVRIVERSIATITANAASDIHPPGYYLLLKGWYTLVGQSVFALRALSASIGILTVALICATGSRLFDRRVGLVAALLTAISPFQVYYSQEMRMYMMLSMMSAASMFMLSAVLAVPGKMRASRQGGPPLNKFHTAGIIGGFIIVNVIGLYTHYSFPFILLAENIVFLIWLLGRDRKWHGLLTWAGMQIAILLLFSPWLPIAIRQVTTWPSVSPSPIDGWTLLRTIGYGITLTAEEIQGNIIPLLLIAVVGLFPPIEGESKRYHLQFIERLSIVAGWLLVPVIALALTGGMERPTFLKFYLPANLALMLLVARGVVMGIELGRPLPVSGGQNRLIRLVVVILLLIGLYPIISGLRGLYFNPVYARDDYQGIARHITEEAGTDAAVVLDAPNQWEVFTYYYPDGENVFPLPDDTTDQTLHHIMDSYKRIYALYWGVHEQDPDEVVETTLNQEAFVVRSEWFGRVRVVTYAVLQPPAETADTPLEAYFGDGSGIRLEGFALSSTELQPGDALGITLFWHTDQPLEERLKVFVHLYGPDGSVVAQHDSEPGYGQFLTVDWQPGETIVDNHGILVPITAPSGIYQLVVGLYRFDGTRLAVTLEGESIGDSLPLGEVIISE